MSLDPLRWSLIPYWCKDPAGGRKPINAKYETVRDLPSFRDAYRKRRCIVPVDAFFEWNAISTCAADCLSRTIDELLLAFHVLIELKGRLRDHLFSVDRGERGCLG